MQLRERLINQPFAVVAVYILPHEEPAGGERYVHHSAYAYPMQ